MKIKNIFKIKDLSIKEKYFIFVLIAFNFLICNYDILKLINHINYYFIFIYIELIVIYSILIIRNIFESFKINPLLTIIGILTWLYISFLMLYKSKILTFEFMNKFLISLTIVGTLLFAFIPQGFLTINEKYKPKNKQLYSEHELSKELTIIVYSLIMFVGIYLFDVLLGLIFSVNKSIYYYLFPKIYNYLTTAIYKTLSIFYMAALSFGISMLIYAFIKIVNIIQYFYFYEMDFEKLKSIYKDFGNCELDWILKKKLFGYFVNKYEIKSPEILIDKFDIIAKDNPKYSKDKIIKQILNEDKAGTILVKMHSDKKVK